MHEEPQDRTEQAHQSKLAALALPDVFQGGRVLRYLTPAHSEGCHLRSPPDSSALPAWPLSSGLLCLCTRQVLLTVLSSSGICGVWRAGLVIWGRSFPLSGPLFYS